MVASFLAYKFIYKINSSGLYYKHITIINDDSRVINKLETSLTDNSRVVNYDHHVFIAQATGCENYFFIKF
jgi:hypothetical protein